MNEPRQQIRAGTTMGHEVRSEMGGGSEREIVSNRKLGGIWGETPQPLPLRGPWLLIANWRSCGIEWPPVAPGEIKRLHDFKCRSTSETRFAGNGS